MKKLVLAAALAAAATTATAGSMEEPVMEMPVIVEETNTSAVGWVVPLLLVAVLAAVAS